MFPNGVGSYVDLMEALIPGMKDGTVRTAIDTGCGVSRLSLLQHNLLVFFGTIFFINIKFLKSIKCYHLNVNQLYYEIVVVIYFYILHGYWFEKDL